VFQQHKRKRKRRRGAVDLPTKMATMTTLSGFQVPRSSQGTVASEREQRTVRKRLEVSGFDLPQAIYTMGYDIINATPAGVLDSPFFTVAGLATVAIELTNKSRGMSRTTFQEQRKRSWMAFFLLTCTLKIGVTPASTLSKEVERYQSVKSARVFWYVRLVVEVIEGSPRYSIEISDGFRVGALKFMRTLVQFLIHSSDAGKSTSDEDTRLWSVTIDGKPDDGVDAEVGAAGDDEDEDESGNDAGDNESGDKVDHGAGCW
jgi:hypothetical protein